MIVGNAALGVPCIANKQNEPIVGEPAIGLPIEIIRLSREGEGALPYIMLHKLCGTPRRRSLQLVYPKFS